MKAIINIRMNDTVSFKFSWSEKGSFISHEAEIIKEEKRTAKSGVVRMDASRMWEDDNGKKHYEPRIIVPNWVKAAVDYAFARNSNKIALGTQFTVTAFMSGQCPIVEGLSDKAIDTSWRVTFEKKEKSVSVSTDQSAEDAAEEVLG